MVDAANKNHVTRQLLFVQGGGAGTHAEWDNKLVDSLRQELGQAYEIHYPQMPGEDDPQYAPWKAAIERVLAQLDDGAIVVGHSFGAPILLKMLSEQGPTPKVGALFLLAAPFIGEGGWPVDDVQFPPKLGTRFREGLPIHFYQGLDDETVSPAHADLYANAIPQARVHRLAGRDHQLNNDLRDVAATIASLTKG